MRCKIVSQSYDEVYCVVTDGDGSTFGQIVSGEESKTIEGIESVIATSTEKEIPPAMSVEKL